MQALIDSNQYLPERLKRMERQGESPMTALISTGKRLNRNETECLSPTISAAVYSKAGEQTIPSVESVQMLKQTSGDDLDHFLREQSS